MKESSTIISISTGTIVRTVLVLIFFSFLFLVRDLLVVVLTAVVIASAIEPMTLWFRGYGVPRLLSVVGTYIALAVALVGIFYFFVPSLLSDTADFLNAVPKYLETAPAGFQLQSSALKEKAELAQNLSRGLAQGRVVAEDIRRPSSLTAVFTDLGQILSSFSQGFWDNIGVFFGGIVSFLLIVVFSFYLAAQEDGVGKFLRVITPIKHEPYVIDLWKRTQRKIGLWMQGQVLLAVLVGILVFLGLTVLGIKNALFLAVLAAVLETIPLFGPIIAAIPAIMIGYGTGGITTALLVFGLYLIIQQFENHLIYPLVVKKIVGVSPILVIIALIIGGELAGFLGLVLSVPLAATLVEYFDDIQKRKLTSA